MSADRSTGADARQWPWIAYVAAIAWMISGAIASVATWQATNDDARPLVAGAATFGALSVLVGLLAGVRSGSVRWFAIGLIVSGLLTPTTFAAALNLIPIVTGVGLLVWSRRSARSTGNGGARRDPRAATGRK